MICCIVLHVQPSFQPHTVPELTQPLCSKNCCFAKHTHTFSSITVKAKIIQIIQHITYYRFFWKKIQDRQQCGKLKNKVKILHFVNVDFSLVTDEQKNILLSHTRTYWHAKRKNKEIKIVNVIHSIKEQRWGTRKKMWSCTCLRHKGTIGSRRTAPLILNLRNLWRWVVSFTPRSLYPREWTGGWIGPRVDVDALEKKRKNLAADRVRTPNRSSCSLVAMWKKKRKGSTSRRRSKITPVLSFSFTLL